MIFAILANVVESWQSGNAPDSKSGEPVKWRAGSIPVLSFDL